MIVISVLALLFTKEGSSTDTTFIHTYGGLSYEEGAAVDVTFDGGYVMVGSTGSFGLGNADVYMVKVEECQTDIRLRICDYRIYQQFWSGRI